MMNDRGLGSGSGGGVRNADFMILVVVVLSPAGQKEETNND